MTMRIDSHQHFWKYDPVRDSWIDDSMEVVQRDFLPSDLEAVLRTNRVDGCVAVQADQSENETAFLLKCAKENRFIKGVVGWVDLLDAAVGERLAHFSTDPLFKGIRHIVQAEPDDFMLRKDFQNGIARLRQFGLTYDILVFPTQLEVAIKLVSTFPDQPFVLDHMAKPYIKDKKIKMWERDIRELATYGNVLCKVSGMVTEADWKNWKPTDFAPYLEVVFDAFGTERTMFGSDWPVCLLAAKYNEAMPVLENYISRFSAEQQIRIMGKNAVDFYNL